MFEVWADGRHDTQPRTNWITARRPASGKSKLWRRRPFRPSSETIIGGQPRVSTNASSSRAINHLERQALAGDVINENGRGHEPSKGLRSEATHSVRNASEHR
jgi:hypothetical protein